MTAAVCGCAQYWNDPAILALNPWLYTLIGNTTLIPIQSVRGCGLGVAQAPIAYSYSALLTQYLDATSDVGVAACINGWLGPMANLSGGVPSLLDAALGCVPQPQLYLQVGQDTIIHSTTDCCSYLSLTTLLFVSVCVWMGCMSVRYQ